MEDLIDGLVGTTWERNVDIMGISKLSFDLDIQKSEFYGYSTVVTPIGTETHRFTWSWNQESPSSIVLYWNKKEMKGDELYKVIDIVDLTSNRLETADGMLFYGVGSTPPIKKIDDSIFVHPLGLQQDIREINPLKFEGFLRSKGISYEKKESNHVIDFYINSKLTDINGVKLPISILFRYGDHHDVQIIYVYSFSDKSMSYYMQKDLVDRAFDDAEKIVEYLKQCGFQTKNEKNPRVYESFEYDKNDISICISKARGVELFCTLKIE